VSYKIITGSQFARVTFQVKRSYDQIHWSGDHSDPCSSCWF